MQPCQVEDEINPSIQLDIVNINVPMEVVSRDLEPYCCKIKYNNKVVIFDYSINSNRYLITRYPNYYSSNNTINEDRLEFLNHKPFDEDEQYSFNERLSLFKELLCRDYS